MNEKNLEKIMTLRKKLEELDQDLNKIKNKNSFFKFFLKSLVLSFIFLLISKYINLNIEKAKKRNKWWFYVAWKRVRM